MSDEVHYRLLRLLEQRPDASQRQLDWLKAPEQTDLRRTFAVWFGWVFRPKRLPGIVFEPMTD